MQTPPEHSADTLPVVPLVVFFGSVLALLAVLLAAQPPRAAGDSAAAPTAEVTAEAVVEATPEATAAAVVAAAEPGAVAWNVEPQRVVAGDAIFHTVCMACHGFNGEGIQGLGKGVVGSEFVNSMSDDELVAFIAKGREVTDPLNTTGIPMPARGGNPMLTDDDLYNVVAYIRSMNINAGFGPVGAQAAQGEPAAAQPTTAPAEVAAAPTTAAPQAVEGGIMPAIGAGELNLALTSGESAYVWSCAPCHGLDGSPVAPFATLPLADSALAQARDDAGLLSFLAAEQPPSNPAQAFPHPYRGGYPTLSDDQLREVIAYMYTLVGAN